MADFNIEDFLAEDDDSPAVAPIETQLDTPHTAAAAMSPHESAIEVTPVSPSDGNRATANSADDFLSWLDDSAPLQRKQSVESNTTKENLMDDFFDEVFGEDAAPSKSASGEVAFVQYRGLDADIHAIVSSSFPDVVKLRGIILEAGYIPSLFRGQVWLLLLTNACVEDHEAEFWRPSAAEEHLVSDIASDCSAAVSKYMESTGTSKDQREQRAEDMRDILALYCVRREVPYIPYLCDLLSPLLLTPRPLPRALASSCFYALCSEFIPLINLPTAVYDKAVHKVHSWLHLLLSYHFPRLVQHLDRIFPGWERPISGMSAAEAVKQLSQHKQSAGLDEMERELGLEAGEDTSLLGADKNSGSKPNIQSMRENERRDEGGCIPASWMSGIFGGTLPPLQTCWLWDWALLNGDRYHGMYATAALLGLCESIILEMSGGQFRTWIKSVVSGSADWYKTLGSSLFESNDSSNELSWDSFTRGWMHSAAAMQRSTPNAFKDALQDTELWAMQDAEEGSSAPDDHHHSVKSHDIKPSFRRSSTTIKQKVGERGTQLLHAVRKFGQQFAESRLRMSDKEMGGFAWPSVHERKEDEQWPHDAKNNYWCLWSSVNEVVPSLCTNQRKGSNARSILSYFEDGKNWRKGMTKFGIEMKGGEDMSFPHVKDMSEPFYFGIDIRSEAEKKLGIFPKAFALDPYSLTDPDCVSKFLATLEPLAETAHLCIIGVGEDYLRACGGSKGFGFRRQSAVEGTEGSHKSSGSVEEMISDYNLLLTNVAMFFLNKGFRHISIVDGGYAAALKYLVRDDTKFSLSSALVDINPQALDRYLGPGTCDKHLGARKQTDESRHHHRGSMASGSSIGSGASDISSSLPSSVLSSISSVGSFLSSSLSQKQQPNTSSTAESNPKQVLEDLGKKFSLFGSSAAAAIKKTVAGNADTTSDAQRSTSRHAETRSAPASSLTFVIDSDEEDGESSTTPTPVTAELKQAPPPQRFTMPDTDKINISRTDAERAQALAVHRLAGLRKGDEVTISKESLPGAILFPATKEKIPENATEETPFIVVHRYLVVTRERFIVLDSGGKGVGATAKVKSNHHLTELLKITYKKKSPELVTLYLATPGAVEGAERTRQYRVIKRKEFVEALQKNMMRFK